MWTGGSWFRLLGLGFIFFRFTCKTVEVLFKALNTGIYCVYTIYIYIHTLCVFKKNEKMTYTKDKRQSEFRSFFNTETVLLMVAWHPPIFWKYAFLSLKV